ncbi:radical SAM protein [Desulfuromonas acetexigens]|uniref:FeMo cofactor biosynthesis protein NifB n=1 Tax=Trichloromonas acetexigens TaxID=38815 RepID=A0A550JGH7_9BACT|nr:radical SAM protein [Desulfuromonas acetexigens]TRO82271.1 radical SAM protein [Desulfuromonas acetexigens]
MSTSQMLAPGAQSHPCFSPSAANRFGRIHLPVAPNCNLRCGYCDRRHDCVNESRPGVTSRILDPERALAHLGESRARMPFLSVVGIAGPGDPMAEPELTLATLELIRRHHPDLLLCLSSNGLGLADEVENLVDLGVDFVTLTINAVDPLIGSRIYDHIRLAGEIYRGVEAAGALLQRQIDAVVRLKARGVTVKINTVVIPEINDREVVAVARLAASLGADLMNLIGMIPVSGTPLEHHSPPTRSMLDALRTKAEEYLPQMTHCARCRADACGLTRDGADHSRAG